MTCLRYSPSVLLLRTLIVLVLVACKGTPAPPPSPTPTPHAQPTPTAVAPTSASTVRVDRRVELLSILHRLIGHQAYTGAPPTPYVQAVDKTFGPFADHPAVAATRALRASHSITWDAPMTLAAHLDDQLQLINPEELPTLDKRFTGADLASYAATLRDFARDTKLDDFLAAHRPYISQVEATLRTMIEKENPVPWFDRFFGAKAKARYIVVPALLSGSRNFGVRATLPDGTQEFYQVLGIHAADGLPMTDDLSVALLIHEMAHSYVNPVTDMHRAALEPSATKLFALVAELMTQQAYNGWKIFVDESIVRAVVVLYMWETKGEVAGIAELKEQERRAFRWTPQLVQELKRYQRERATHADFAAFVPELIEAFDGFAAAIK